MTDKLIQVAVIGAGKMGTHHARTYQQIDQCELVAVVDKDIEAANKTASQYGGRAITRLDDLLLDSVDAVSVAVPTVYHEEVTMPLIVRGIATLVEKPLAQDAASAKRLFQAVQKHHCLLQVGHSERFNPVVQAMLRLNVKPRFIETQRVSPFTFRSADVGVVADMMIHDIDIVLHLIRRGSPSLESRGANDYKIDAVGVNVLGECEDVANARVRFADGSVANMTASRLALKTERRIRIFCPTAYITMDYQKKTGIAVKLQDNLDLIKMAKERNFEDLSQMQNVDFGSMVHIEPLLVENIDPLRAEIESFLHSVRTNDTPVVSAEDGLVTVEMADRIADAIKEQHWKLPSC